jgi:hypothetical protein
MASLVRDEVTNAVSELVREYLIDSYYICAEVGDDKSILRNLKKTIKYYSTPDQWEEFKEEAKNAGNVA